MSLKRNRKAVAVIGAAFVLIAAAGAYAYWTTTGSGTGSATTGTSSTVTVTQVGSVTALVPGSAAQAVNFSINNTQGTPQFISSVTYSIASIETAPGVPAVGCTAGADFTLVQPTAINTDLANGITTFSPSGATLAMKDTASNQNGCKSVTVNLAFAAS
jgi:hypothetical protein